MGIFQKLLKLFISLNILSNFRKLILKCQLILWVIVFETVFEVVDDVEQGVVLVGLHGWGSIIMRLGGFCDYYIGSEILF